MSASEAFAEQQRRLSETDKDCWLGQLVWYGVSDVLVSWHDLATALVANGLGPLPKEPSDVDIFRRVCTRAQKKRQPSTTGQYDNYLIRDIPQDDQGVHKVLVRETVQAGGLQYETQLCTLTYNSKGTIKYQCVKNDVAAEVIVDGILKQYEAERGSLNSHAVRELIRKLLLDNHAINVRGKGGGLYFVPRQELDFFERLEGFAAMMPNGNVDMGTHPVLDDSKRRDMLRRAMATEIREEVAGIGMDLDALNREGKKISKARMDAYYDQFTKAQEKIEEYDQLLEETQSDAHADLDVFLKQLISLGSLVDTR